MLKLVLMIDDLIVSLKQPSHVIHVCGFSRSLTMQSHSYAARPSLKVRRRLRVNRCSGERHLMVKGVIVDLFGFIPL